MLVHKDPQKKLDVSCPCSNRTPSTQDLPESLDCRFFSVMVVVFHLSFLQISLHLSQQVLGFGIVIFLLQRNLRSYPWTQEAENRHLHCTTGSSSCRLGQDQHNLVLLPVLLVPFYSHQIPDQCGVDKTPESHNGNLHHGSWHSFQILLSRNQLNWMTAWLQRWERKGRNIR